ncbi:GTPase HflX [Alicyclobacillus mali]|uniref:GTPase HflX n=1 Tax=Alicyclobacillus mali (ex Roth et al. 2021) TaxID=1123961 RepID=A0ABS0F236_9BACL|nr:GTPase HflX [Alicyclobacillus mali (ex Roth et al. 2021)]MBF8377367.1 GTPase HflX [Alicyclobacillus mali (ex Roth et al. 2021)]MCL6487667.1 GTPase HflX [Alicyclobacillus mali (ex Roth et al. 2021)]
MEREKAVLLVWQRGDETPEDLVYRVEELTGLCEAAGAQVVGSVVQRRRSPDARWYLGQGKVEALGQLVETTGADLVVADSELRPTQARNVEDAVHRRVVDRTVLILDIFARRAVSREGKLQVEIAQLKYLLPRLAGRGALWSRLGGGIGTRGPGETKLELDRRRIRARISKMERQLAQLSAHRSRLRQRRVRDSAVVALVGYTNAGKTTVRSRWVGDRGRVAENFGRDRLFDTLDVTARRVFAPSGEPYVVTDTVGFVEHLPHHLVEAFRSTLEEVAYADVIVLVVDASRAPDRHLRATRQVLADLRALDKPLITFYNKMDLAAWQPPPDLEAQQTVYGSAAAGDLEPLYRAVEARLHQAKEKAD